MPVVTLAMIAAHAKVSGATVSLALRHDPRIKPETRERVARAAEALGYQRNPLLAQLMAQLRKRTPAQTRYTIALLNALPGSRRLRDHPGPLRFAVEGCRERARAHGYGLDEFWLHDADMSGARLAQILRVRGISGVVFAGLRNQEHLLERFHVLVEQCACVAMGVRTTRPVLPYSSVDHHLLMTEAMRRVVAHGYRRPGLVLAETPSPLVNDRYAAAFTLAADRLPAKARLPVLTLPSLDRELSPQFARWLDKHRPDVVLGYLPQMRGWVEQLGKRVPRELGLVMLDRFFGCEGWAHMDQHNRQMGEAAVDLLLPRLHNHERGLPEHPGGVMHEATWVAGSTLRQLR